ncbi:MAG: maleylpyruvate isomerase family mycothiol-dependent enzyme [Acidimicrobiia bacterium]
MDRDTASLLVTATRQAWASVEKLIDVLDGDDWDRPTPCVGWSVKDLVAHLGHIEGLMVHGFDQPDPTADWVGNGSPLDQVTGQGVSSRRGWSVDQVAAETRRAGAATLRLFAGTVDWEEQALTPIGPATRQVAVEMRVNDLFIHLCDLRAALGLPVDHYQEPAARTVAVGRATRLTPWAWVKRARATEGQRLRLDLSGPGGIQIDVVVRDGRAVIEPQSETPDATVKGSALAYLLAVSGRHALIEAAGGLVATGEPARLLLEKYRLVG